MRRRTKLGFAAAIVALLAAAGAAYVRSGADRKLAPADPPQPIPVIAATVQERDVPIVLNGLGAVTPLNTATVRSQITGLITSVNFKEGQFVKKGDLLA